MYIYIYMHAKDKLANSGKELKRTHPGIMKTAEFHKVI